MSITKINLNEKIPSNLKKVAFFVTRELKRNGYEAYLVGGSVRDMLLGKECYDLDFTTNATPHETMKIFPHHVQVGVEFGTIIVLYRKAKVELTTYRTDCNYRDGRRPDQVIFGKTLEEDVFRRDFTVNGMAYDLEEKILFDYVGGLKDIKNKYIRTIRAPIERFREDGLRPIRACRFAASLSFKLDSKIFPATLESKDIIAKVARERFYEEWRKTLFIQKKDLFWKLLYKTEIYLIFLNQFSLWKNDEKRQDFFEFLKFAQPTQMAMYLAYLIYFEYDNSSNLENIIVHKRNKMQKEFRCPARDIKIAFEYVTSPIFSLAKNGYINISRRYPFAYFLAEIPVERVHEHIHFFAEIYSYKNKKAVLDVKKNIEKKLFEIQKEKLPIKMNQLAINGNELSALGYKNIEIGNQLKRLHKVVIRYPQFNNKSKLLKLS